MSYGSSGKCHCLGDVASVILQVVVVAAFNGSFELWVEITVELEYLVLMRITVLWLYVMGEIPFKTK